MEFTTALVITSFVIIVIYFIVEKRHRKLPPGPYGVPILGYIPFMSSKPYLDLQKLARRYGPIFRVRLGTQNVIVLSDYHSTKTAFAQDAFMGRPPVSPFDLNKETIETGAFNGLPWKEQKRFSMRIFKDLGFGKTRMELAVNEEIQDLLHHFDQLKETPFVLRPILAPSMSNNIGSLVYGNRLKYNDPVRKMLDKSLNDSGAAAGQVAWELFFPKFAAFFKKIGITGKSELAKTLRTFKEYTKKQIEEHEGALDENNIRDYIDGYLLEIRKRKENTFCKAVLQDMVGAFFGAGSNTVRDTVEWLMLTMAKYTNVQEKVYSEIESVIGRDGTPCWNHHKQMPYSEATIMETMRWRTIVPLNPLRYTLWDSELEGFFIPKEHYVIANLWDIHHNPEYWGEDADDFRVERFLAEDGKEVKNFDYFIPFSIGKRQCPGEPFAKMEVFLYFVSILQKFKISLPPGRVPDFDGNLGISLSPIPQDVCLTKRY